MNRCRGPQWGPPWGSNKNQWISTFSWGFNDFQEKIWISRLFDGHPGRVEDQPEKRNRASLFFLLGFLITSRYFSDKFEEMRRDAK